MGERERERERVDGWETERNSGSKVNLISKYKIFGGNMMYIKTEDFCGIERRDSNS